MILYTTIKVCFLVYAINSAKDVYFLFIFFSLKGLLNGGLDCFSSLVDSEQYMAAINSLYYILPFFVKSSDELLEKTG